MRPSYALDSEAEDVPAPFGWLYDWDRQERLRPATEVERDCWLGVVAHPTWAQYLVMDGEYGDELAYWRAQ